MENGWMVGFLWLVGLGFGVGYDRLVSWLERSGRAEGFTALMVVGGVGATLGLASLVVGLEAVLMVLLFFGATGLPMVIGAWERYTRRRQGEAEQLRALVREVMDDKT